MYSGRRCSPLAGVAILIGLGIWQLERKVWKENLIATLTARLARAPAELCRRARLGRGSSRTRTNTPA